MAGLSVPAERFHFERHRKEKPVGIDRVQYIDMPFPRRYDYHVKYSVLLTKKTSKRIARMPSKIRRKMFRLIRDLETEGPIQIKWSNYSKLGPNTHHCHLSYGWAACWRMMNDDKTLEVYYAGSREDAPY